MGVDFGVGDNTGMNTVFLVDSKTLMDGIWLVIALLFVEIARVLSYGATWAVSYRTGIRVRGAVLALLFKRLAHARSLRNRTSAEVSVYSHCSII